MSTGTQLKNAVLAMALLFGLSPLHAAAETPTTNERLSGKFVLTEGEMDSVRIGEWKRVRKLYVQAYAVGQDATVQVIVNGDVKGTLYLPAQDPSYIITVEETASSVEFQHISGGRAKILEVRADLSAQNAPISGYQSYVERQGFISQGAMNTTAAIAAEAIELANELEYYADLSDCVTYLLPIKKVAARTYALANARSDLSSRVRGSLIALMAQIDFASTYLDNSFERDATFDIAIGLLTLRERISALLL